MFYIIINILFVIITTVLVLRMNICNVENKSKILIKICDKTENFINNNFKLLTVTLFLLTIFTSLYKLGNIPYGMHVDEAGMAYDAYSIAKYGVDRYLNNYPIYLINYGGGQSAMYAYVATFFIKIFGLNIVSIRLPSVVFRLLIFIFGIFIIKNEKNNLKSIIFIFLLTIVPFFIMQSRFGLDCNLLIGFLTISIYIFIKAIEKNSTIVLVVSGFLFGLSLYTYALSYIIIPILLFFICTYLIYIKRITLKKLIAFGLPIFILALPLILMIIINNGYMNEIKGIITIPKLKQYRGNEISIENVLKNIYIIPSILSFDSNRIFGNLLAYNSTSYFGTIYYCTIPFVIYGLIHSCKKAYKSIKNKKFDINIVFIYWFFSVLICQLLIFQPNINKANAIFLPIIYYATIGIYETIKKLKILIIPIFLILLINFSLFYNYYLFEYNNEIKEIHFFATHFIDALEYSKNLGKEKVYIQKDLTSQEYIYILLNNNISPYKYNVYDIEEKYNQDIYSSSYKYKGDNIETLYNGNKITYTFNIPNDIKDNSVYIIGNDKTLVSSFKELGLNYERFGMLTVFSK